MKRGARFRPRGYDSRVLLRPNLVFRLAAALAFLGASVPAMADKLTFDHRLAPALKAVLDGGDPGMVAYNASNPKYVTDLIAVRGRSAKDWTEALVIIARTPDKKVATAGDWAGELQREAGNKCAATFTELARDETSVTFERRSTGCAPGYPPIAIYRAVGNGKSLFLLAVMVKDDLGETERGQWLALMNSAHIE